MNKDIIGYCSAIAQARRMLKMGIISLDDYEKIDHDWKVDVVLSHTTPLKYEPVEVFLPQLKCSHSRQRLARRKSWQSGGLGIREL